MTKKDTDMRKELDILIRRELALALCPVDDRSIRRFDTRAQRKELRARIWNHIGLTPIREEAAQNQLELDYPAGNMPGYDRQ